MQLQVSITIKEMAMKMVIPVILMITQFKKQKKVIKMTMRLIPKFQILVIPWKTTCLRMLFLVLIDLWMELSQELFHRPQGKVSGKGKIFPMTKWIKERKTSPMMILNLVKSEGILYYSIIEIKRVGGSLRMRAAQF